MKQIVLSLMLAVVASAASAGEWFLVTQDDAGQRWLGKAGSLEIQKNQNGILVASAVFAMVEGGRPSNPQWVGIALESCVDQGGEMAALPLAAGNIGKFWWSVQGKAVYDMLGIAICRAAYNKINKSTPETGLHL